MKTLLMATAISALLASSAFAQAPSGGTINGTGDKTTGGSGTTGMSSPQGKSVGGHSGAMSKSGNGGAAAQGDSKDTLGGSESGAGGK